MTICNLHPKQNIVIVRLGHKSGQKQKDAFKEVYNMLKFADQI